MEHDTWNNAFNLWLSSRGTPNTRRAYRTAWQQLTAFTGKQPWVITSTDIAGWIESLRAAGLSRATLLQRLAAISSFYIYVMCTYTIIGPDGGEQPLHHYNPVSAVPRPKVNSYHKAKFLSADQARAFLAAIPRSHPQGFRDYALFLGYLITGRRNTEIRTLRWGDFEVRNKVSSLAKLNSWNLATNCNATDPDLALASVWYRWRGKGKSRSDECPLPFWYAINRFLQASNRFDTIKPEHYIFTPLRNNANRFPHIESSSFDKNCKAGAQRQPSPLSARFVRQLLKRYAYRAGLDPKRITVHTLRHTAAMLRREAGEDIEAISRFLNHSSLSVTQTYLHRLTGHEDNAWVKVQALLGLEDE
jgi:site-specific recombinase XerD